MQKNTDINWIDIAKGLGIISVVVAHSYSVALESTAARTLAIHLNWFHMPLFFFISGYLYKPVENWNQLFSWGKRRSVQLLLPYFIYLYGMFFILVYANKMALSLDNVFLLLKGGRFIGGHFGVFGFITLLLMTQIAFATLHVAVRQKVIIAAVILFLHYLAQIKAVTNNAGVVWNADVVLVALTYYAIGFYLKDVIANEKTLYPLGLLCIVVGSYFFIRSMQGAFYYNLSMKSLLLSYAVYDIVIPFSFTIVVLMASRLLSYIRYSAPLAILGAASITIMYLHIPLNVTIGDYDQVVYVLIGLLVPFLLHMGFKRHWVSRKMLLGIWK